MPCEAVALLQPRRLRRHRVVEAGRPPVGDLLLGALALMLVIEGLLPFFSPGAWRRVFERAVRMSDGQIRFVGLTSMLVGVVMLLAFWN